MSSLHVLLSKALQPVSQRIIFRWHCHCFTQLSLLKTSIVPRSVSLFFLYHSRWFQYLGNLSGGEGEAWPDVWHSVPIDGLRLRCITAPISRHTADDITTSSFVKMHHSRGSASSLSVLQGSRRESFSSSQACPPQCWLKYGEDTDLRVITFQTNNGMDFNGSVHLCVPGLWLIWIKMERWTGWSFPLPWSSSSWNSRVLRFHQHCQSSWSSLLYLPTP